LQPILKLSNLNAGADRPTKNTLDLARLAIAREPQAHSSSLQRLAGTGLDHCSLNGCFLSRWCLL
jgi:hypothetical protein